MECEQKWQKQQNLTESYLYILYDEKNHIDNHTLMSFE